MLTDGWFSDDAADDLAPGTAVRYPDDLSPHPLDRAESWQVRAVLDNAAGATIDIQAQLDRLALRNQAETESDWGFTELMRATLAEGREGQQRLQLRERLHRRALGLADSHHSGLYAGSLSLLADTSVTPGETSTLHSCRSAFVLTAILPEVTEVTGVTGVTEVTEVTAQDSPAQTEQPIRAGQARWSNLTSRLMTMDIDIGPEACPEFAEIGRFKRWQANDLDVTARIQHANGETERWQGHAWMSSSWGALQPLGGAVVLDQVMLRLESNDEFGPGHEPVSNVGSGSGRLLLLADRSKRRSGKGPVTLRARTQAAGSTFLELSLEWIDEGIQVSEITGVSYPRRFHLSSTDGSVDLRLTPLVTLPEINDAFGPRWSGAVRVSGSHSGTGYVDYIPLIGDTSEAADSTTWPADG